MVCWVCHLKLLLGACIAFSVLLIIGYCWRVVYARKKRASRSDDDIVIGIFHPYCNAGGGGERVLWYAVKALQTRFTNVRIVIYTGDLDVDPNEILNRVEKVFNIKLMRNIQFVYLHRRKWIEAEMYPHFTMFGQSLGSVYLGLEALNNVQPDIFLDTVGYAFTYPLFKFIGGCRVATYTHYPTISTDMLRHVYRRIAAHNNKAAIARNPFLTGAKLLYYKFFAWVYGWCGSCADIVMVNSSWTEEHINAIWKCPMRTYRVFPPCDVKHLTDLPLLDNEETSKNMRIISVGQFRPEKNHGMMLRSLFELRSIVDENVWEKIRLVFVGSCRNHEDEVRVKDMQDLARHLSLENNVEFKLNIPFDELVLEMRQSTMGLHAMWNEHFGISVVENMAAGLIMIANNSGGPRYDIIETQVGSQNGFLATTEKEYAETIASIIKMDKVEKEFIRNAARASVSRFSNEQFMKDFLRIIEPLFRPN